MLLLLLSLGSLQLKYDCIKGALLFYTLEFNLVLKLLALVYFLEKKAKVSFF